MPKKTLPKPTAAVNPALPFTPITIHGVQYKMCFDHAALALAEDILRAKGHDVNLLGVYLRRTYSNVRVLFAASLVAYQPEIDFDAAQSMVTPDVLPEILIAVVNAWNLSMPEPDKENPPAPTK